MGQAEDQLSQRQLSPVDHVFQSKNSRLESEHASARSMHCGLRGSPPSGGGIALMNEKGRRTGCAALDLDLNRPLRAGVPLAVVAEIRSRRRIVGSIGLGARGSVAAFRGHRDHGAIVVIAVVVIAVVVIAGIVVARAAVIGVAAANRGADGYTWPETATPAVATVVRTA